MTVPAMTCGCIEFLNDMMMERNSTLDLAFLLDGDAQAGVTVKIATRKLIPKKRGKAMVVVPTFCPFCGVRLEEEDACQED